MLGSGSVRTRLDDMARAFPSTSVIESTSDIDMLPMKPSKSTFSADHAFIEMREDAQDSASGFNKALARVDSLSYPDNQSLPRQRSCNPMRLIFPYKLFDLFWKDGDVRSG